MSREKSVLKILGRANSFNVRKVLWICDELGIAFERKDWGRGYQLPTSTAEFLQINPIGLIPAVIDDGVVLRKSQFDRSLPGDAARPGRDLSQGYGADQVTEVCERVPSARVVGRRDRDALAPSVVPVPVGSARVACRRPRGFPRSGALRPERRP